ncbi:CopD family protein [Streptomyces sp. NPDC048290]|uniref:CopD family protein n=1 Tax=Streptomyces sp. NPDC048290 TaxID=3155811 RepID=UPI003424BE71
MTLIRPTAGTRGYGGPGERRPGTGRAVAVLVLVTLGALIPLLGPSAALYGTGENPAPGVGGIALLRTALFTALCIPVGELFVQRLAGRLPGAPAARPRSWALYAAGAGFLAALGLASVVATGNLVPGGLGEIDVGGLYESRDGKLALLEINAFALAGLLVLFGSPRAQVWPLAAIAVAEALRAHPTVEHSPLVGSALTLVHVTCSALWVGGLVYALRTLRLWRRGSGTATGTEAHAPGPDGDTGAASGAALLGLYARVAAVLLAATTATGIWSTLRRMPPETVVEQLTETAYGRVLLAKVLLVVVVTALALSARSRLRRVAGRTPSGRPDLLRAYAPARAEVVALGVVVAVSGLLTALPVPIRW